MDHDRLMKRARRAYELGRLGRASRFGLLAVPPSVVSVDACTSDLMCGVCGSLLAVLLVAFAWRGETYERAIWPGFLAGITAFSVPLIGSAIGLCAPGAPIPLCLLFCVLGGLAAGAFVGLRMLDSERRATFLIAGISVAGLVGSLGCAIAGIAGVTGMIVGVAITAAPIWIWAQARA
jgi:hypothetical protein